MTNKLLPKSTNEGKQFTLLGTTLCTVDCILLGTLLLILGDLPFSVRVADNDA